MGMSKSVEAFFNWVSMLDSGVGAESVLPVSTSGGFEFGVDSWSVIRMLQSLLSLEFSDALNTQPTP